MRQETFDYLNNDGGYYWMLALFGVVFLTLLFGLIWLLGVIL